MNQLTTTSAPPHAKSGGRRRIPKPANRLNKRHREWIAGYLFIAPDLLGIAVFVGIPMVFSFIIGFFHASGFGGYEFVGLDNYRRMFSDPLFVKSVTITVVYVAIFVPTLFCVSLALALLVRKKRFLVGLFRSLFFAPNVVSLVVVGLVWQFLLVDKIGVVNQMLSTIGLSTHSWLGNPKLALATVLVVSVWFFMGYYMTIFLAGLHDIPGDYYDAARLDGAGPLGLFRHVTWPLLKPTSFFVLMLSLITGIGGLQAFDLIYVMTKGGPNNATQLVIFYIYQQAFQFNDFGYAAAMASFVVFLMFTAMLAMFKFTGGGRFDNK